MNFFKSASILAVFLATSYACGMKIVQNVSLPTSMLDATGKLKDKDAVAAFLTKSFAEKKLTNVAFSKKECIKVTDIMAEGVGWNFDQLFLIESSCAESADKTFVLKETKSPDKEIPRLVRAAAYEPLKKVIYPNATPGLPQLIFPIAYLSYKDMNKKQRYFTLMNAAPGESLYDFIREFMKKPSDPKMIRQICESYFDIGATIAKFYKEYETKPHIAGQLSKSIVQGDFHASNIFLHNRHIVLIDNETIEESVDERQDIGRDIAFFLIKTVFVFKWKNKIPKNFAYKDLYELSIPNFFAGFLSTYPATEVDGIFESLASCLRTYRDHKDILGVFYTNKDVLGIAPKTDIEPILERIKPWFLKKYIALDIPIDQKIEGGKTHLFEAIAKERLMMWPLIIAGADVNAKDADNNTPLHDAAELDKPNAIKILLDAGALLTSLRANEMGPLKNKLTSLKNALDKLKQKLTLLESKLTTLKQKLE